MSTRNRIVAVLAHEMGVDPKKITDAQKLAEDLGMDSLDLLSTWIFIEEEFEKELKGKDLPDASLPDLKTVGDVVKLLEELV